MLHVPQLDDMNYSSMFERARRMIPRINAEWTDLNHHDPGITTLQMFYWLIDSLNYYLDATGEQHRLKYLKLLGISSLATPARCFVAVDGNAIHLPHGTKLYADDTVFETVAPFDAANNELVALYNAVNDTKKDMTRFAGVDGSFAEIFSTDPHDECSVYFGFQKKFSANTSVYFEVAPTGRNAFGDEFSLAKCTWEYYDGKNFLPCTVLQDETCGFLRTGFVHFDINTSAKQYKLPDMAEAYYLRCTISDNEYDILPAIGRVFTACAEVRQTNTLASTHLVSYKEGESIELDFRIGVTDSVKIAKQEGDEFVLWYDSDAYDNLCELQEGRTENERRIVFDGEKPQAGDVFAVFVCDSDIEYAVEVGITDGCAGQRLFFEANLENMCEMQLALVHEQDGKTYYELWHHSDDMTSEGYESRCFGYDVDTNCFYFGDGINGLQPEQDKLVVVVGVKTSLFEGGNVLQGRIDRLEDGYDYAVTNIEGAIGGSRRKNSDELEQEIEAKITAVTRAVTAEDYKAVVMNTPGLMIDSMNVISIKDYCEAYNEPYYSNTVVLSVKPKYGGRLPILSESYKRNIASNLKKYRLLTTEIRVESARYVGVSVYGRIALVENTSQAQSELKEFITSVIDRVDRGEFGKTVDYGRLFSALELHKNVKVITDLSLEYSGNGGYKNEQGDIVVHPDSLSYLNDIGIEFV